jgi:hypothetical protein
MNLCENLPPSSHANKIPPPEKIERITHFRPGESVFSGGISQREKISGKEVLGRQGGNRLKKVDGRSDPEEIRGEDGPPLFLHFFRE